MWAKEGDWHPLPIMMNGKIVTYKIACLVKDFASQTDTANLVSSAFLEEIRFAGFFNLTVKILYPKLP